jgi:hypothetical protein
MVTRRVDREAGLSLVELVTVLAILGVALAAIFAAIQVLTVSATSNTANSYGTNDLSYTMELVSRTLMDGKVLYANDAQVVVVNRLPNGTFEVDSIYATGSPDPAATSGRLVWERWSSNASGTAPAGNVHFVWVMSETDANMTTTPTVALFSYYKDATDASVMSAASGDKATTPDTSLTPFTGTLPGGYTVSAIGRIRLHAVASFATGVRGDTRDTTLRMRG